MNFFATACQVSIIAMTLSLSAHSFVENSNMVCRNAGDADEVAGSCLCNGVQELVAQHPEAALSYFEKASHHRKGGGEFNETDFLIEFCTAIALDQLGNRHDLFRSQAFLDAFFNEDLPRHSVEEAVLSCEESLEAIAFLQELIPLAPSSDTRAALQSIVAQISKAEAQDHIFAPNGEKWQGRTSKFIKRWRHILRKVREIAELVRESVEIIKIVEETFN